MRSRRSVLAAGATGTLALSAGCLGFVLGNEPLEFTAARAAPTDGALEETGYDEVESNHETLEERIEVGVSREVRASFWVGTYAKELDLREVIRDRVAEGEVDELEEVDEEFEDDELADATEDELPEDVDDELDELDLEAFESQEAAFFAVLSTPSMEVFGRSFNPLQGIGNEELIGELNQQSGTDADVDDVRRIRTTSISMLGESRDVDRFEAVTEIEGEEIELELLVATFEHEDDYLVVFGGYPAELEAERDDLERLFESVEHPLD